jgi:serine-type D-Ala-D-Ala carboxypeptidase (penicillin-binding protein 5/6)
MTFILKEMKRKNKKRAIVQAVFFVLGVLLISFFFLYKNEKEEVPEEKEVVVEFQLPEEKKEEKVLIQAEAVISLYYKDGEKKVLYEKNKEKELPIASISKLMTALVVFENYNLEEEVNVSGITNFKGWKETKIKSVVSQMIVESNNVSSFVLATVSDRFISKEAFNGNSVQLFVEKMNHKAKELGLEKTSFINPSGLDEGGEYNISTATEMADLSIYIIENQKDIFEISKIPIYYVYSPSGTVYYQSFNTNYLIYDQKEDWQKEIVGGKTGTTVMAGQCLLVVLKEPETEGYIINIILGSDSRFDDMSKLINHIKETYNYF